MAKNDKRISIAAFDKVAKEQAVNDAVFDWHGVEITVKYTLGLTEDRKSVV